MDSWEFNKIAGAVLAALRELTKQDFGPDADASEEDRDLAMARWRAWWKKNRNP